MVKNVIDKDILNEQNISAFTMNDSIDLDSYDNLRRNEYEENVIIFKHATLKETNSFSYITNIVIQAFKELGKDNITDEIIKYKYILIKRIIFNFIY